MEKYDLPKIADIEELEDKYVFVRASLNVPVKNGVVLDEFRIMQSLPTINYLIEKGAKVILCSHLGKDGTESLAPVYEVLKKHMAIAFSPEVTGAATSSMRASLQRGEVLLLENVRKDGRELENDVQFAEELASLADIFVNDDFAASHRAHASLSAICQFLPSYVGMNFAHEYEELSKAMSPQSPSLFILGGAKFETKMPLVEKFLSLYDHIFIAGALANDFFKAQGYAVGTSLVSDISLAGSPLLSEPKLLLPVDVIAVKEGQPRATTVEDVRDDESILDAGPATAQMLEAYIRDAKSILWNGPLGNYEGGFKEQTVAVAKLIADSRAYSVIGGGDTVAAIEELHNQDSYSFLSTAGGAMLTFLELGTLPALEAIVKKH